jgi:phosphoribosylamine-glycine ligase
MKVLVIGSGGREHALCWALKKSPLIDELYAAPGNGGIAAVADCVNIPASNHHALIEFCGKNSIDFVVVGPEQPLVEGLVDELEEVGIAAFGPNQAAAILEGSKAFTKNFCSRHNIPTGPDCCQSGRSCGRQRRHRLRHGRRSLGGGARCVRRPFRPGRERNRRRRIHGG